MATIKSSTIVGTMSDVKVIKSLSPTTAWPFVSSSLKEDIQHETVLVENGVTNGDSSTSKDGIEQLSDVQDVLRQMNKDIGDIATTIKGYVSKKSRIDEDDDDNFRTKTPSTNNPPTKNQPTKFTPKKKDQNDTYYLPTPPHIIPEVRDCNWETFKNHFSEQDGNYAIDALVGRASMEIEAREEAIRRNKALWKNPNLENYPAVLSAEPWIHKVRLQSSFIVKLLARFAPPPGQIEPPRLLPHSPPLRVPFPPPPMPNRHPVDITPPRPPPALNSRPSPGAIWDGKPLVFKRPFRCFVRLQPQMKGELLKLEEEFSSQGDENTSDSEEDENTSDLEDDFCETVEDSKDVEELEQLRCYIKFVDERILPFHHQFDREDSEKPSKIRHIDLWHLFRLGELVHLPKPPGTDDSGTSATQQNLWRVYRISDVGVPLSEAHGSSPDCFQVACYYLDYDGSRYGAIGMTFLIHPYTGERDITSLPVYPLKFATDPSLLNVATESGEVFVKHISEKHGSYSGWTLTHDPRGEPLLDGRGNRIKSPEHIDSEVLVDFKEAFNHSPGWKPLFFKEQLTGSVSSLTSDPQPVIAWSDSKRTQKLHTWGDRLAMTWGLDSRDFNSLLRNDPFLKRSQDPITTLSKPDLALLPTRIVAYALWERKFVQLDVRYLQNLTVSIKQKSPFDQLQISPMHKKLIQALVSSHFSKKSIEDSSGVGVLSQDIIRNKGKGVVILLHGVPGVGKTATAEAVAQKWGKPLFPITCGDLGFTANAVEKSLGEIFRLAHLWGCVLLLDEADVFITQRTKTDLQRNALVSVFLRMLEYYNGILFLTTNRPGMLDEAVKSRVHLSLRYDSLDLASTLAIFSNNIAQLRKIEDQRVLAAPDTAPLFIMEKQILEWAEQHFNTNTEGLGRWNGRQIRNGFSIAASLAHFEGDECEGLQRVLRVEHFKEVHHATLLYDQYRESVLGGTDGKVARELEARDDEFVDGKEGGY